MIIAWTFFVVLSIITLMALLGAVICGIERDTETSVEFTWIFFVCAILTSVPAQFIWGGGL